MARQDNEVRITPSILDRLIDLEPDVSREAPASRSRSLADLKQSVRRDLEWLLNTRVTVAEIDDQLVEIKKSVICYGLPDITGVSAKNPNEQRRMTKAVENAIRTFEPRFVDLKVTLEPAESVERLLRFRIDARLDVEPAPEPISFDTVLQLGNSQFEVREK